MKLKDSRLLYLYMECKNVKKITLTIIFPPHLKPPYKLRIVIRSYSIPQYITDINIDDMAKIIKYNCYNTISARDWTQLIFK